MWLSLCYYRERDKSVVSCLTLLEVGKNDGLAMSGKMNRREKNRGE